MSWNLTKAEGVALRLMGDLLLIDKEGKTDNNLQGFYLCPSCETSAFVTGGELAKGRWYCLYCLTEFPLVILGDVDGEWKVDA